MPETEVLVPADKLTEFAEQLLLGMKLPPPAARLVAVSLVASSLRGVDSHGVQLLPYYVEQFEWGNIDLNATGHVIAECGSCLTYDGENGIGQVVAENCTRHAIRMAKQHGMALVVSRESNHFGAAAYWAQTMSSVGLIGIVMCNASSLVPPWQGREPRLGTNPICMSVPGPWLLDMATTTVAAGKIFKAYINGIDTIPAGWAMDKQGVPTTNTEVALNGLLMPLGGYKGYGLAMLVEILCAGLSGGAMSTEVSGIRDRGRHMRTSQMFLAIDVARFMPLEEFRARIEHLVGMMKSAPAAKGYDEVLVAGDPEWRAEAERRRGGVPVGGGTWDAMVAIAAKLGVAVPACNRG